MKNKGGNKISSGLLAAALTVCFAVFPLSTLLPTPVRADVGRWAMRGSPPLQPLPPGPSQSSQPEEEYIVTFLTNGGRWGSPNGYNGNTNYSCKVTNGGIVEIPDDVYREGYEFKGWKRRSNGKMLDEDFVVDDDVTFDAQWEKISKPVIISFDTGYGRTPPRDIEVMTGEGYGELPDLRRRGYLFEGWSLNGTEITRISVVKTETAHTLLAVWSPLEIYVSFDYMDGEGDEDEREVVFGESYGALPEAVKRGGSFAGWFTDSEGGERVFASTKVSEEEDHTLYARWDARNIAITFDSGGGADVPRRLAEPGKPYGELPVTERDGYIFTGWYKARESGSPVNASDTVPAESHTLYARWQVSESEPETEEYSLILPGVIEVDAGSGSVDLTPENIGARVVGRDGNSVAANMTLSGGELLDLNAAGEYRINVNATVAAPSGSRVLNGSFSVLIRDMTGPVIEVAGTRIEINRGDRPASKEALLAMAGASATDNYDSEVAIRAEFADAAFENINWNRANEYALSFEATDSAGNEAARRRIVIVAIV